jgi:hypothetical protein
MEIGPKIKDGNWSKKFLARVDFDSSNRFLVRVEVDGHEQQHLAERGRQAGRLKTEPASMI